MGLDKIQSNGMVNEAKLDTVGSIAREGQDSLNSRFDKELGQPLRIFASVPADAKLNIASNVVVLGDGSSRTLYPLDGLNQAFTQTTINFQTGALSISGNVTVNGATFALPASVSGQYRRMAMAFQNSGKVDVSFSPSVASYGSLQDLASLFATLSGTPIGYIDLVGTATSTPGAFKTASSGGSSATSVIEGVVGGASAIFRFGTGSSPSSGSGTGNPRDTAIRDQFTDSPYAAVEPNIFSVHAATKIASVSGCAYDAATKTVKFTANAQVMTTINNIDLAEFGTKGKDIAVIDLDAFWNRGSTIQAFSIPTAFTYEVSRDGGANWYTVTMARIGDTSDAFRGTYTFSSAETPVSVQTQTVDDAARVLNATTQQAISQPFVVTAAQQVSQVQVKFAKTGSPTGNYIVTIVKDSAGNPSVASADFMSASAALPISGVATGVVTVPISAVVLPPGTYHIVVTPDATYRGVFNSGVTQLALRERQSSPVVPYTRALNAGTWAIATTNGNLYLNVMGRLLDLRVRVTSAGSPTYPCGLDALATFFNSQEYGLVGAPPKTNRFVFDSVADNTASFTLGWTPDPNLLTVFSPGSGGMKWPDFQIAGNTVTFPANTFNNNGIPKTMYVTFDQNSGGAFDNNDVNARLLAFNHLGSTSVTDDKSATGRGIFLRDQLGTLKEVAIGAIPGRVDGTAPAAGMVGEVLAARQSTPLAAAASGVYKNVATITLTPGTWLVYANLMLDGGGSTIAVGANQQLALSTTTASQAGSLIGSTLLYNNAPNTSGQPVSWATSPIEVTVSVNTPYFVNGLATYTGTIPSWYGAIVAQRKA